MKWRSLILLLIFISYSAFIYAQSDFPEKLYFQSIPYWQDTVLAKSLEHVQKTKAYYTVYYRGPYDVEKVEYWFKPTDAEEHQLTYVTYYRPHRITAQTRNYRDGLAHGIWCVHQPIYFDDPWNPFPTVTIRPIVFVTQFFFYIHKAYDDWEQDIPTQAEEHITKDLNLSTVYMFEHGYLRRLQAYLINANGVTLKEFNVVFDQQFPDQPITVETDDPFTQLADTLDLDAIPSEDPEALYASPNSIASGYLREYNEEGALIHDVQFANNAKDICEREFDPETGSILKVTGYKQGEPWGNTVIFDDTTAWIDEINRIEHGTTTYRKRFQNEDGRIIHETTQAENRGIVWEWDNQRRLERTQSFFSPENDPYFHPEGIQTTYAYFGPLRRTAMVDRYDEQGQLHHRTINVYAPNGQRIKEENYGAGMLPNGVWRYYDDQGNLNRLEEYRDGRPHGYWYYFESYEGEPRITQYELYELGTLIEHRETHR
jgi:antitoxin component YwqK of YwqJK toxin-antitoxin module